jgi:hypothetical protein
MRGLKYTPVVLRLLILLNCIFRLIFKSIIPSVYENYIDHTGRVQGTPAIYPQSMTEGLGFLFGLVMSGILFGVVFVYTPNYSDSHLPNWYHLDKIGQHACHRNNPCPNHKHVGGCWNYDTDNTAVDRPTPIMIGVEPYNVIKAYMLG